MHCAAQLYKRCAAHAWRAAMWFVVAVWVSLAVLLPSAAHSAEPVVVSDARLVADQDGAVSMYAQFEFALPTALEEAANRGIALYFAVDFELYRNRWYWFDKKLVVRSLSYRLTYSPLTRQYRLGRGTLALPFETLDAALGMLKRIHGWRVAEAGMIDAGADANDYRGRVRLRLDTSRLPKPFQLTALTSSEWTLTSGWYDLPVVRRTQDVGAHINRE